MLESVSDSERVNMSVLGACWHRPILGEIEEVLKELKQRRKIGECIGNKGKEALKQRKSGTIKRGKLAHVRKACKVCM
jgi:hypothetical protein